MNTLHLYRLLIILGISFVCQYSFTQPLAFQKKTIEGVDVYTDLTVSNQYYYAPGSLTLKKNATGRPEFQLLQMRYTGTKLENTVGEKRFTNIVQFGVEMEKVKSSTLKEVKKQLGKGVKLYPLPIKNVAANVVVPAAQIDGSDNDRILNSGSSSQAYSNSGINSKTTYWSERTFTLKLDNAGSQLLWSLLEEKKMAISVGYAFSADMLNTYKGDLVAEGDSTFIEQTEYIAEDLGIDSLATSLVVVKSGSFAIELDVAQHPDLLKKTDINDQLSLVYPSIEVRCYDFLENLRPDLAMKKVKLKAFGINNREVELPTVKILSSQPDLHTFNVSSDYVVSLERPLSYQIIEITEDGEKKELEWQQLDAWGALINATTPNEQLQLKEQKITFEYGLDAIDSLNITKAELYLDYWQYGNKKAITHTLYPNNEQFYETDIYQDKGTDIRYQLIWWDKDSIKHVSRKKRVWYEYYYLSFE